jgi:aldehyde dehydrogenase (NAD+)
VPASIDRKRHLNFFTMHTISQIEEIRKRQLTFFSEGKTKDLGFRKEALGKLRESVRRHEKDIYLALHADLGKSEFEAYATETGIVLHEIGTMLHNLSWWARHEPVVTPLFALPSKSMIVPEPLGRVLIISPWNYPFQLPMVPLAGAIAAGNVAIIRQSRFSPSVNAVIRKILSECFPEDYVAIIECDLDTAEAAINLRWDLIFFTGSTEVGRRVYTAAAHNLTPVILELGGKSPAIVEEDAGISLAARRIVWGKLINAGQTCISPDHVFVHKSIREKLVIALISEIEKMYGSDPLINKDYPKIISEKAFERLLTLFKPEKVLYGGKSDRKQMKLIPTLIDAEIDDICMKEEIFGPLLPIIGYSDLDEVVRYINSHEKPLAVYFFSTNKQKQKKVINDTSSGACLINDVLLHIANKNLPFGGVGESGTGRYHGRESFRAFSNLKAVMKSSPRIDIPVKYPPFSKTKERILKLFLR